MNALPYQINIRWENADEAYVASVPALRGCVAVGDTPEEAAREILIAAELWLEATAANGKPIPAPDLIPLSRIQAMKPLLNLSALARAAGISTTTLASKLDRETELTREEAIRLSEVLGRFGILSF